MSFILDALKKLEQKRQQGAVPDVMTIHTPERQKSEKRVIWPYLVLGLLVLNAGILAAVFRPWEAENKNQAGKVSTDLGQKKVPESPIQQVIKQNESASASPQIKRSAALPDKKQMAPKFSPESLKNTADIKKAGPAPKKENPPAPAEVKLNVPHQIEETRDNNKRSSDEGGTEVLSMNPSRHEMEVLRNKIKEETSHSSSTRPPKEKPVSNEAVDSDERVPDFSQLPEETRKEIPSITISAHIYSNDPRSRIVNINGSTLKEGDDVIKGLKVREITMSGVILDYQGRRFQVRAF